MFGLDESFFVHLLQKSDFWIFVYILLAYDGNFSISQFTNPLEDKMILPWNILHSPNRWRKFFHGYFIAFKIVDNWKRSALKLATTGKLRFCKTITKTSNCLWVWIYQCRWNLFMTDPETLIWYFPNYGEKCNSQESLCIILRSGREKPV